MGEKNFHYHPRSDFIRNWVISQIKVIISSSLIVVVVVVVLVDVVAPYNQNVCFSAFFLQCFRVHVENVIREERFDNLLEK